MAVTYDQINALYQQYLGRPASQDEAQNWINGTYGATDLAGITSQIASSGEAQTHAQQPMVGTDDPTARGATGGGGTGDWWGRNQPGVNVGSGGGGGGGVTDQQSALQAALGQGLKGQAAVDWVQQHYPQYNQYGSGIEWQPSTGTYGIPGGYFAQNPSSGTWGMVQTRPEGGGGGGFGGGGGGSSFAGYGGGNPAGFGAPPTPYSSQGPTIAPYQTPGVPSNLQTPYTPGTYTAPTFTAPTGLTEQNDPGYLERMRLANQGMEASAAARGTVLGGGFQKALAQYNQDYASNEFQNVYNRARDTAGFNAGNQAQAFQMNTAGQQFARQQNQGEYQAGVGNAQNQYGLQYQGYLNENARTLQDYLTNVNVSRNAASDYWGRLRDLSNSGLTAASNPGP